MLKICAQSAGLLAAGQAYESIQVQRLANNRVYCLLKCTQLGTCKPMLIRNTFAAGIAIYSALSLCLSVLGSGAGSSAAHVAICSGCSVIRALQTDECCALELQKLLGTFTCQVKVRLFVHTFT